MGLLSAAHPLRVDAGFGWGVLRAILAFDVLRGLGKRLICHVGRVGPHVRDQACLLVADGYAFVQLLGDGHCASGGEPELAVGLLLERAGDERSGGTALGLPLSHFVY